MSNRESEVKDIEIGKVYHVRFEKKICSNDLDLEMEILETRALLFIDIFED